MIAEYFQYDIIDGQVRPRIEPPRRARYLEWDCDRQVVIEYRREGECNGCGDCCRAMICMAAPRIANVIGADALQESARNGLQAINGIGIWNELNAAGDRRFFRFTEIDVSEKTMQGHACAWLADNKCTEHHQKVRVCWGWPFAPSHVAPFPRCSYKFLEIGRWPMEKCLWRPLMLTSAQSQPLLLMAPSTPSGSATAAG